MPLSISSSSERLPAGPWLKTWVLAAAIVLGVICCWEGFWRVQGFKAMYEDSPRMWALERKKLALSTDPGQVVFIGGSRVLLGIDIDVFDRNFPGPKPIQLAVGGSPANPVLFHLAEDESFRGILISSVGYWIYTNKPDAGWDRPLEYIRFYGSLTPADLAEQEIISLFQGSLALMHPSVNPVNVMKKALRGKWPEPPYLMMLPDRSMHADYSMVSDMDDHRRQRVNKIMKADWLGGVSREDLHANLEAVEAAVDRIQGRGGRVVFFQPPITGVMKEMNQKAFPRETHWDVFTSMTDAVTVHYEDYPSLSGFDCPDYSHLDHKDAVRFSKALAEILAGKLFSGENQY